MLLRLKKLRWFLRAYDGCPACLKLGAPSRRSAPFVSPARKRWEGIELELRAPRTGQHSARVHSSGGSLNYRQNLQRLRPLHVVLIRRSEQDGAVPVSLAIHNKGRRNRQLP